jgi:insulysin
MPSFISRIAALAVLLAVALPASGLQKHPDDKSVSRTLTLDNGLKVLLISDPAFNNSAASLDVQVGSLSDPRDRQGLAHFLEHMLFLGTEKYPDVDEYSKYLQRNGGRSNAFTSGENTNYHFAVRHEAYEGALDRFAQFFIGPLFTPKYTEREVKAVQSEHKKNLMNDGWRFHLLIRRFFKPEHAANHFGTGNDETLAGVTDGELRAFYNKYYSANVMSLCMLSNQSLDAMEAMAREKFSAIKNKNLTPPKFDPDFMPQKNTFRLVEREPVKDLKELSLTFAIPGLNQWYKSKPASVLGHCIGHEGQRWLLSYLKNRGLATGLSGGGWSEAPDFGRFSISVQLTDTGVERYQDVVAACFSYVSILQKNGIPDYVFGESKAMAELDYTYSDKGEGTGRAIHLASNLNAYSLDTAETASYLYEKRDPAAEKLLLDRLIPENMICVLTAKGRETDKKEAIYGTKYKYSEDADFFAKLKNPTSIKALHLPAANPFIPKQPKLYAEQPVKIINGAGAEMWYSQDVEFDRPKISLSFRIRTDGDDVSLEQSALLALYTSCTSTASA